MKCHFKRFVTVLVVHIVDKVKHVYIKPCKPIHHLVVFCDYVFIAKRAVAVNGFKHRRYLQCLARNFILDKFVPAAVDCVKKTLCKVCPCAEELHIFTDAHTAYATRDTVIVAHFGTHKVVAFVLDSRSLD